MLFITLSEKPEKLLNSVKLMMAFPASSPSKQAICFTVCLGTVSKLLKHKQELEKQLSISPFLTKLQSFSFNASIMTFHLLMTLLLFIGKTPPFALQVLRLSYCPCHVLYIGGFYELIDLFTYVRN